MEKLNVAIADDNERMLQVLGDIVRSDEEFHVVGTAKDGEEAYEMIKKKEPDVVLLDIVMPKLDGLAVMDKIKNDRNIKKHPAFIMISAIGQEKITEDAFDLGADYYIMKPFDSDVVINRIKHVRDSEKRKNAEIRKVNPYEKKEKQTKISATAEYGTCCVIRCSTINNSFCSRSKRAYVYYLKCGFTRSHVCRHE